MGHHRDDVGRAAAAPGLVPVGRRRVRAGVQPGGSRIRNIQANPRVTFNLDGDSHGGDIVVLTGRAAIDRAAPGADRDGEYLKKYRSNIDRTGMSLEAFAKRFSVPVRIRFYRLYGH